MITLPAKEISPKRVTAFDHVFLLERENKTSFADAKKPALWKLQNGLFQTVEAVVD